MMESLLIFGPVLLFLLPVFAGNWVWLFILGTIALIPAIAFGFLATDTRDSLEQGFMIAFAVVGAVPALAGSLARAGSLYARGRGHMRPASLWIEAGFFVVALLAGFALVGF